MAESPYLVCLALIEQNGQRRLPIGGGSLAEPIADGADPGESGRAMALDLLLLELPMDCFIEALPKLKSQWIKSGDTTSLMQGLRQLAGRGWVLETAKYSQPTFSSW